MANINKSQKREQARLKAKHGQRGSGKWLQLLRQEIIKRGEKNGR